MYLFTTPEDKRIMRWIEEYQTGKSGIYPHQVSMQVCAEFGIPLTEARHYVMHHIRSVMDAYTWSAEDILNREG